MTQSMAIDLGHLARDLNLPTRSVEQTVELLDEGNTVPFITRYRKDQTGGLDEEQIRDIQWRIDKIRQLLERKATILKTIESQGKLTPELAEQIQAANTPKRLEDLYLPFKPKKQTLATIARERGLEPLAVEIFEDSPEAADLQSRAATFVSADRDLHTTEEVLAGVGHLIAERYSENAELRGRLRRIFQRSGRIVCTKVETPPPVQQAPTQETTVANPETAAVEALPAVTVAEATEDAATATWPESTVVAEQVTPPASDEITTAGTDNAQFPPAHDPEVQPELSAAVPEESAVAQKADESPAEPGSESPDGVLPAGRLFEPSPAAAAAPIMAPDLKQKKKKKKKKKVIGEHAFKDYYDFSEPLGKVPPHRVLAINRGERAHAIRVKIDADLEAMSREADQFLIRPDHPHAAFLRSCLQDALTRLIVPSLERELRREMTERAEEHAVDVFVRNLRRLLLQPPTRNRRVLAIDPGFKSGSKMVALDEFGNVLGHGMIFVIGKDEERRKKARTRLADMAKQFNASLIAIGNGTGCRETEQLVADVLADELKDRDVAYVIVNEAGASIYSTSPLGREELPQFDALQRGAISIGRRLLDPLSEMVKINPANLGVGLYQHDIKAKHLKDSLDAVVESAVNFVGVDVNSASPALLRYVSGMNALTARRVYEHRREKGPFRNREELKQVAGFGDQTFVQAAGFLKVIGSENPLDATWIHPESYDVARRVLEKIGCDVAELAKVVPAPAKKEPKKEFAAGFVEAAPAAAEEPAPESPAVETGGATVATAEAATGDEVVPTEAVPRETVVMSPAEVAAIQAAAVAEAPPESVAEESPIDLPPVEAPAAEAPAAEAPAAEATVSEPPATGRNLIAERAAGVEVSKLAAELGVGTHLLEDILTALVRPGLDPRDNLSPPLFRRGIMKLEDLQPSMELSGTVLNVVDFGVFVDIGLSDSGLVHISRLADRFIRDPHEVVGVGDVLKVWVVDVDKARRRVSLTAIAPGSERAPRERQQDQRQQGDRPPRQRQPQQQRPPRPQGAQSAQQGAGQTGGPPQQDRRPPRPQGGGRRDQGRGRPQQQQHPKTVERRPTKPKPVKPLTKAMEDGKEPLRSFSDLQQLFDKKKKPKPGDGDQGNIAK